MWGLKIFLSPNLCPLVKVEPVLLVVLDKSVTESGVIFVVEDGEVLEEVGNDNVDEDDSDEEVVGDEPHNGCHDTTTVAIQLGTVVMPNLSGEDSGITPVESLALGHKDIP